MSGSARQPPVLIEYTATCYAIGVALTLPKTILSRLTGSITDAPQVDSYCVLLCGITPREPAPPREARPASRDTPSD